MNELQALVTGILGGALAKASAETLDIEVTARLDDAGNYKPELLVTGRQSGIRLLVAVIDLGEEEK